MPKPPWLTEAREKLDEKIKGHSSYYHDGECTFCNAERIIESLEYLFE